MNFLRLLGRPQPGIALPTECGFDQQLKALTPFLCDETIEEIWFGHADRAHARSRERTIIPMELAWTPIETLDFIADLSVVCGVRLDPMRPFGGGVLPGLPWRWHASIPPFSPDGPRVSFRRQRFGALGQDHFNCENFDFAELARQVKAGVSLLFFGATGSGKTSLMVSVMKDFFYNYRVGIAETVLEIPLVSPYWFRLTEVSQDTGNRGGVDFQRVVSELMRATPDLIVLGEIRGSEAGHLGDLARSGHGGVCSTIHAGSFEEAMSRIVSLSGHQAQSLPRIAGVHVWRAQSGGFNARFEGFRSS
jgi:Flp pilus assembly CpaF family ATPase